MGKFTNRSRRGAVLFHPFPEFLNGVQQFIEEAISFLCTGYADQVGFCNELIEIIIYVFTKCSALRD